MLSPTISPKFSILVTFVVLWMAPGFIEQADAQQAQTTASATGASGAEYRYVEANGIRYMETRSKVRQPVRDFRYVDMPQTYYLQRYRTDYVNQTSVQHVPQTKYECVPRLYDWWRVFGVFGQPYVQYGMEPETTWQSVPRTATVPLTRRELAQQTRTVKVAVPFVRMVEKEQISRVAVGPATNRAASSPQNTPALAAGTPRYPGAPQTRLTTQPIYVPANGSGTGSNATASRQSIDPGNYNPFGGWSVAGRQQRFGPDANRNGLTQIAGNDNQPSQDAMMVGQGLSERFGGIARLDGDFPRYGTGPQHSESGTTFQATRPQ